MWESSDITLLAGRAIGKAQRQLLFGGLNRLRHLAPVTHPADATEPRSHGHSSL